MIFLFHFVKKHVCGVPRITQGSNDITVEIYQLMSAVCDMGISAVYIELMIINESD